VNILGVIPARGGSKGVPGKNIVEILGKPLIGYTIDAALQSDLINYLTVSTDSIEIANVVSKLYDVEVIQRPPEFARDDSPIEDALLHAIEHVNQHSSYQPDIVVWMQPNVPIRETSTIDATINKLIETDADSCITCYEVTQIPELMKTINDKGILVSNFKNVRGIRRQEFSKRYLADGSVVAMKKRALTNNSGPREAHAFLGNKVAPLLQSSRMYSLEIDDYDDLALAEFYIQKTLYTG
jgi:CMP-N,N'-diacetyllegionaminic acid synthase